MAARYRFSKVQLLALLTIFLLGSLVFVAPVLAQSIGQPESNRSITDRSIEWPTWQQWRRVLSLQDYNTRVVILGTTLLGCAAGVIGSFTLLRKRALMGDAISHATLPGIGLAFIIATALGVPAKSLPILLLGATITGLLGVGSILFIRKLTRLKEDTAIGAVLSVFFGAGVALLGIIQHMKEGSAAGLEAFIYGKTASMVAADTQLIAGAALVSMVACGLMYKEFKLLCFDDGFAGSEGFSVLLLDLALMSLVVIVCIVGLQAVGLILMIALLVIPAAAARFWTEDMGRMVWVAAALGAVSGMLGASASALFSKLPSGAMIVLVCASFFVASMFFGPARGVVVRYWRRRRLNRAIAEQHLLRAMYEILETRLGLTAMTDHRVARELTEKVALADLMSKRSWSLGSLKRQIRRAERAGWVSARSSFLCFRQPGLDEAERLTRQHRLWELYLITHADVAPAHVDRDADAIEHVLESEIVAELELLLEQQSPQFPASPHELPTLAQPPENANPPRAT